LKENGSTVGRTQGERMFAILNAKGSAAYAEALAEEYRRTRTMFEDSPKAIAANRTGRAPIRDTIPATNASSLYSSTDTKRSRKR
jgi:hypothetical protein